MFNPKWYYSAVKSSILGQAKYNIMRNTVKRRHMACCSSRAGFEWPGFIHFCWTRMQSLACLMPHMRACTSLITKCLNGHFQALTRPNKMTNRITTYCKCYDLSRKLLAPKKLYYEQNSLILRRHSRLENCNIKLLLQEHHLRSSLKNDERSKILWKLIYIQDKIAYLNFTSQLVLPFQ